METSILNLRPGLRVLDAGCGSGAITRRFAKVLAPTVVTGIDVDSTFIAEATKKAKRLGMSNVEFLVQDLNHLDFGDAAFDLAYCRLVLPFVGNPLNVMRELKRVTRPEGRVAEVEMAGMFAFHEPKLALVAAEKIAKYLNRGGTRWKSDFNTLQLMRKAGLRNVEAYPIPEFASRTDQKRLRELVEPEIMQQEIHGEDAVHAKFLSRKELLQGRRDLDGFLTSPDSFWMVLMLLRVGTV